MPDGDEDQHRVERRAHAAGIVECRDEQDHARHDHGDALEHAQRAGLEVETVLEVQRESHEAGADEEAQ